MISDNQQATTVNRIAAAPNEHSPVVKLFAHIFSYLFHPLFIPAYVVYFIAFIHPSYFAGFSAQSKILLLIRIAYTMIFLPLFSVLLLKGLKIIDSFFLKT